MKQAEQVIHLVCIVELVRITLYCIAILTSSGLVVVLLILVPTSAHFIESLKCLLD